MSATMKRALLYVKALKLRDAEYAEACKEWRKDGHRPKYCKHGTYMWADWDVICGACEDGYDSNLYAYALMLARSDVEESERRRKWLAATPNRNDMPHDLLMSLVDWACAPVLSPVDWLSR